MASGAVAGAVALYWCGASSLLGQIVRSAPPPKLGSVDTVGTGGGEGGHRRRRVVLVTGATSGIGRAAAHQLAALGYRVIIGSQDIKVGELVADEICAASHAADAAVAAPLALESEAGIERFCGWLSANGVTSLHAVVCNAAVMLVPFTLHGGYEEHFAVNVLGHFRLMRALLPALVSAGSHTEDGAARVVVLSSVVQHCGTLDMRWFQPLVDGAGSAARGGAELALGMEQEYSSHAAYARSKLAVQVLAQTFARKFVAANLPITVQSVDPGIVYTPLYRNVHWMLRPMMRLVGPCLLRSVNDAAAGVVWAVASTALARKTGGYYAQGVAVPTADIAADVAVQVIPRFPPRCPLRWFWRRNTVWYSRRQTHMASSHAHAPPMQDDLWRRSCDASRLQYNLV
jgi:NAD(P)-dependent dehydrogenase (short-subunit alcohol dehydrogenase family)